MNKLSDFTMQDIRFRNSTVGLLDISVGLAFILAGIAFRFNSVAVTAPFYLVILLLITILRQKAVYPRIGYAEHKGMEKRVRNTFTITLIVGIVMLIAATIVYLNTASGSKSEMMRNIALNYGALILGTVIAFVSVLIGKTYESPRLYLYAPLIFAAFCVMQFVDYEYIIAVSCLSLGVAILSVGLICFIRFLRKYPRLAGDQDE